MAVIDEVVGLEEDLKKARFRVIEVQTKVRKLSEQISSAEKRLVSVERNLESCRQALTKALTAPVISLYVAGTAGSAPGDWLKARKLVDQNQELVVRIKNEIRERTAERETIAKEAPHAEATVRAIEGKLSQYGVVKEFKP